jgi:hypothetical protein
LGLPATAQLDRVADLCDRLAVRADHPKRLDEPAEAEDAPSASGVSFVAITLDIAMNSVRRLTLVACALVVACGPASGASGLPAPSPITSPGGGSPSVTGTITAGPVSPVESSPPNPQCAPRPVAGAVIVATNASGQEVGRATSAADGSYQLIVGETGTVLISALPVAGLATAPAPVSVTLASPSEIESVDFEYDTGIR